MQVPFHCLKIIFWMGFCFGCPHEIFGILFDNMRYNRDHLTTGSQQLWRLSRRSCSYLLSHSGHCCVSTRSGCLRGRGENGVRGQFIMFYLSSKKEPLQRLFKSFWSHRCCCVHRATNSSADEKGHFKLFLFMSYKVTLAHINVITNT